jgi:hypothetical protein
MSNDDKVQRGKKLLLYGMFALVLVTIVATFVTVWVVSAPAGSGLQSSAFTVTAIVGAIVIVACVIVWFVYNKLILKE